LRMARSTTEALLLTAVLALLVLVAWPASAQDCDRPSSVQDMTECATLRLRAAEREMGEIYGSLLDSQDKEFAAAVRKAQEAWMKWREAESALAARTVNDPTLEGYTRKRLEAQMTEDRIKDLRSYSDN